MSGTAKELAPSVDKQAVNGPVFRFRLERVRAVRERKEKLAQQELAKSISRMSSRQAELASTEADLAHARDEHRTAAAEPGAVQGGELLARQAFLERIEAQRRARAIELERSEAEVAARNASLASAASEHEMLNRLRERRRREHDREQARRESHVLDEIAAARFRRGTA